MNHAALILASGSPRRRELLSLTGLPYVVDAPEVDESCALPPSAYNERIFAIFTVFSYFAGKRAK